MIYLACPYSHPDSNVREYRFMKANQMAARLMRDGHIIYSPISHTHPIAMEGDLPLDWAYWQSVDEFYIRLCEKVIVLTLAGWKNSKGVQAEIEIARALDKPVEFMGVGAV
jgi:hypothetical protein